MNMDYSVAASSANSPFGSYITYAAVVYIALVVISLWRINVKAGQPGWAAIVPFYNLYIELKIIKKPGWWLLLLLIPYVNIVMTVLVALGLAKAFGKSPVFAIVLLVLLPFGYLILGFDKSKYLYSSSTPASQTTPPTVSSAPSTPPANS
jgi:hypothetical protein